MKRVLGLLLLLFATLLSTSCIAIGYSNEGGWFVWPGGLGLLIVILLVLWLLRRRR